MSRSTRTTLVAAAFAALTAVTLAQATTNNSPTPAALSTMTVDGPDGRVYRFDYRGETGWKFVGFAKAMPAAKLATNEVGAGMASALAPQGRFVDSRTGYVFKWSPDLGWHFVGAGAR